MSEAVHLPVLLHRPSSPSSAPPASCAQVAGAVAVYLASGPQCPMLMGRPDKAGTDILTELPSPCDFAADGIDR